MYFCNKCKNIYTYIDNFEEKQLIFYCSICDIKIIKKIKCKIFSKIIKNFN